MSVVKSFAVGNGDMFYIKHNSDSFTIIDCDLNADNADAIINELRHESADKGIKRFISTHPDGDHFGGIHLLDDEMPIDNFYAVKNQAIKDENTASFQRYCQLRDDERKAYYIEKGSRRRWLNETNDERHGAGVQVLWPDTSHPRFQEALADCEAGENYNNTSAVLRYSDGNASVMWLGDLETSFMEDITDSIELPKTTIVFAAHHGRLSGKIPDSWLYQLDPQIIILGEAPSRQMHYYTGYRTITQNRAGDITMHLDGDRVHFYVSNLNYKGPTNLIDERRQSLFNNYIGTLVVETEYTR